MTFQMEMIKNITTFCKLVVFAIQHGGDFPAFSTITTHVMDEHNRLVTLCNERLKRIQELEADVKNLRGCNSDLRDMVNEAYGKLDQSRTYGDDLSYQVRELVKALNDKDDKLLIAQAFIEQLL